MDKTPQAGARRPSIAALYLYEELRSACDEQTANQWLQSPGSFGFQGVRDQCRKIELNVCPPSPRSLQVEHDIISDSSIKADMMKGGSDQGPFCLMEIQRLQGEDQGDIDPPFLGLLFTSEANLVLDKICNTPEAMSGCCAKI
eukprot:755962-Hanusia_phi.AAC.4